MKSLDPRQRIGSVVGGKYRIVHFIAEGGMGAVYEASHLVVQRRFALKFLRSDLSKRRDGLERFRREAIASGSLESDNIAAAVDFGVAPDGTPYIVMEYLAGVDLGHLLIDTGPLPVARATELVIQTCRGIQMAHARRIIHRDLKPKNLVLCRRDDGFDLLKIVDFGLARLVAESDQDNVTGTGGVLGTAAYMSPEQARGDAIVDHRTDLYSIGVIAYELLSGKTPHPGNSYNAIIHHILTQAPLPLPESFPALLGRGIERALAREPKDRFQSAEELIDLLLPFAERKLWPPQLGHASSLEIGEAATLPAFEPEAAKPETDFSGTPRHVDVPASADSRNRLHWLVLGALALSALWLGWQLASPVEDAPVPELSASSRGPRQPLPVRLREESDSTLTPSSGPGVKRGPISPMPNSQSSSAARERPPERVPERTRSSEASLSSPRPQPIGVKGTFDTNNPYD